MLLPLHLNPDIYVYVLNKTQSTLAIQPTTEHMLLLRVRTDSKHLFLIYNHRTSKYSQLIYHHSTLNIQDLVQIQTREELPPIDSISWIEFGHPSPLGLRLAALRNGQREGDISRRDEGCRARSTRWRGIKRKSSSVE